MWLKLKK
ncbi:hypothetical protein BVRB_016940, partial [Beta vulgaris subsp. vulgaris]